MFFSFLALTVQFDPDEYLVTEGGQVAITVELSDMADRTVTVQFSTVDDSATGIYAQVQGNLELVKDSSNKGHPWPFKPELFSSQNAH